MPTKLDEEFTSLYTLIVFCICLWLAGKFFAKLRLPALVGEILSGIILGPHVLELVGVDESSTVETLKLIGNVGLLILVLEAGLDVDIQMYVTAFQPYVALMQLQHLDDYSLFNRVKLIGPRGLVVAVVGSLLPLSVGFCVSYCFEIIYHGKISDIRHCVSVGAAFAPSSMGIVLNVLRSTKSLNSMSNYIFLMLFLEDQISQMFNFNSTTGTIGCCCCNLR